MSRARVLKYSAVFTFPITVYIAFTSHGWLTFLAVIQAFILIPLLELFIKPDNSNLSEVEEDVLKDDPIYDWIIYAVVPIHFGFLLFFFFSIQEPLLWFEKLGRTWAMGIMCGVLGINVAHELGHRSTKFEQFLAKALLMTSLYMHFYIEHNRGHHKNVSTPNDPSSSRLNESLYRFWFRTVSRTYIGAWKLEFARMKKKGYAKFSLHNEMLRFQLIQWGFIGLIWYVFGLNVTLHFLGAAVLGFLLLETVNYIEHYGLARKKVSEDRYERVMPAHSWNSDHVLGRLMLFELSRHSDHHFHASRKYQILKHHENSPQMPTGYPGMMLLSTVPPLWFRVMNKRIEKLA